MLAVSIIGILAGIATPSLQRSWKHEQLKIASRETTNWLEGIRLRAIQQSQTCVIQILDNSATLQPDELENNCSDIPTWSPKTEIKNPEKLVICSQISSEPSGLPCSSESSNPTPSKIIFTPRGTIAQGGLIKIHIGNNVANRCIAITQPLGMIRQGIERKSNCHYNTSA